jgi:transcriptional regulator with GAF, ATPase, and Fis domain/ligand-binding sensor domain-containing protein
MQFVRQDDFWRKWLARAAVALGLIVAASSAANDSTSRSVRFQHIGRDDGLSQSFVYSIVQDRQGYMWFGTQDGLNRFDGFEFTVFVHDVDDPNSISDESMRTMIEDRSGTLWIGTDAGGLSRYNRATQTFTNYVHDPTNPDSISDNRVRVVYEDSAGALWVGTDGAGLERFNRDTGTFEHFPHDASNPDSLAGAHVWSILEDSDGALLVATDGGLSRLDPNTQTFAHFKHDPTDPSTVNDNHLRVLFEDADNNLWIGTESGGLNLFDRDSSSFEHFVHNEDDASSISANRINAIFQDEAGVLWIGTVNGLNAWNPVTRTFERYFNEPSDRYSLSHDNVSSIFQDRGGMLWVGTYNGLNRWNQANLAMGHYRNSGDNTRSLSENVVMSFAEDQAGNVWVATYGGGLNLLDRKTDQFRHIRHMPDDDSSLSSDRVTSLHVDRDGVLWAGTRAAGLNRYDSATNSFTRFQHDADNPTSISSDGITFILEDRNDNLLIGTFGGGLNAFDRETRQFRRFQNDPDNPESLSNDRVLNLFEDSTGTIWVGTYGGGLNRFDPSTGKFTSYRADPDRPDGLSGDEVYMIQEAANGDLWIGIKGRGLNRWRRSDREAGKETFDRLTTHDGLPSSTVYSGVWDRAGYLWLSTGRGMTRLDIESLEFKNYDTSHGLQDEEFNLSAGFGSADGQLFFGGVNGFNAFYPHLLGGQRQPPQVVITKFLSLNKPVDPVDMQASDGRMHLDYNQNVIGFEFAALDFAAPEKNRYIYQLEGLEQNWVDAGTRRQVTYTNLPSGTYTFRVKASNNDGVWSEREAVFDLYMQPAPWRTWWAYLVYLLALAGLVYAAFRAHAKSIQQADTLRHAEELGVIQTRLTDAQRIAKIGNWEWNTVSNELWWSDEIYRLFQVKPGSLGLTYDSFLERVHPDDREDVNKAVNCALTNREPYSIDHRIIRSDGTELIVHDRAEIIFDENGQPIGMTGTVHDVTERKKAENDIRHRADFQALLAELSTGLIQSQSANIDRQLIEGLESVGTRYELDAISVWWLAADRESLRPLHRWVLGEEMSPRKKLVQDQIPWIAEELLAGRSIIVDDVEQLPLAASTDQKVLRQRGTRSLLILPLLVEEKLEGACVYATIREKRDWLSETVAELRLVAEILAGAIARSRAMGKVEHLKNKLQQENLYLREEVKLAHGFDEIVGENPALKQCLLAVEKVAPTDVTTLILGETGTGKELIARAIHKLSSRSDRPMVSVNCPALPATLIESELFGHEKGAFTGAQSQRRGRFELANTGTLFLDEIGDLPIELQGKLLRVLQTGEFQRIGGTKTLYSDVRLIAATNLDLLGAINRGTFRADLYYRLNSFPIRLPALRDRRNDIPLLAEHFVHKHAERLCKKIDAISAKMIEELVSYSWPGNVRELESIIERAMISAEDKSVLELPGPLRVIATLRQSKSDMSASEERADLFAVERAHIVKVLEQTDWKISGMRGAASLLGIPSSTLRSKMKRLGIVRQTH